MDSRAESDLVAAQLGRIPRDPWRVSTRCRFGYPNTIASPSRLADGTPFPTLVWLTCPWLTEQVSSLESSGAVARWTRELSSDEALGARMLAADTATRASRAAEADGEDACAGVGIAGQRDPLKVKCLHAHVALALFGIDDPIGTAVLGDVGEVCPDERCARLMRSE